ncbi:MAG: helix-turn-helix domain-containing protein [Parabacteroides sp.]|nr:helix-turn-helix domain-containing protein [Parabacteroides sp.]
MKTITGNVANKDIFCRNDFYQIFLLKKGSALCILDFDVKEMGEYSASVIFPNQIHKILVSENAEAEVIMFDKLVFCSEILANELKEYNVDLQRKINFVDMKSSQNTFAELLDFVSKIKELYENMNMLNKMQIKFMIKILLLKIISSAPDNKTNITSDKDLGIYMEFREKVDLLYASQRKVHVYADLLGVSAKKLTSLCYQYCGKSPLSVIHDKLSFEIKKRLVLDDCSLKELSFDLGFSSQSALNKYIFKEFSLTPQALQQTLMKKTMGKK